MSEITELRTDAIKAEEYRRELVPLLDKACDVFNRARNEGLIVSFQIGLDQYGRSVVQGIGIVKPL